MINPTFRHCYSSLLFLVVLGLFSAESAQIGKKQLICVPKDFIWGAALSEYQVSGAQTCTNSNWSEWEAVLAEKSADACKFWQMYPEDIKSMKELGIKSLRFSIEWCKIEPEQGKIDYEAVRHYKEMIQALLDNNIEPMITLHHFVHPAWFEAKGGFAVAENIVHFEEFCGFVFEHFSDKVKLWCTINEPTIFTFQGYVRGVFPPGKKNLITAWSVLRNLMTAHTKVYHRLKAMPNGADAQIGLVHQYLVFESHSKWNLLEKIPGLIFNNLVNGSVIHFLKTGKFRGSFFKNYDAPEGKIMDFVGLNYYSRAVLKASGNLRDPLVPACHDNEIMTDMPYAIYPQGFYNALMDLHELNLPIYVTENGIADAKDDRRELYIKEYLAAMERAIKDGADVKGYYYWSLMDNFEWDMGYGMKFGLYAVDYENKQRTLRAGAQYYKEVIASMPC